MQKWICAQRKTHCYPSPMIYAIGKIYSHTMGKVLKGVSFAVTLATIRDGTMWWYAREDTVKNVADKAFALIKENPAYMQEVRKRFMKISPALLAFTSKKIMEKDLAKASDAQLWELYAKYLQLYDDIYTWGEPITLGLRENVGEFLKQKIMVSMKDRKKANDTLNVLASPTEKSFVKKEEEELLKIAVAIQKDKETFLLFKKDMGEIKNNIHHFKKINRMIGQHTAKFCWVPYDYGVSSWDKEYFLTALKAIVQEGDAEEKLRNSKKYYNELPEKQKALIKELKLDKYHQSLFKAIQHAGFLMDYKKEIFTVSHYHMKKLLEEIGRRFGISRQYVQMYLPAELKEALLHGKQLSRQKLDERNHFCAMFWDGDKVSISEGKAAHDALARFNIHEEEETTPSMLDGMIASAGKVMGVVRVVLNAKHCDKVQKGDILVAPMTSPDYVPAMRRAAAIVTDEGGITCHAAIISRELGIPCVIGTKVATKVLKDGDVIEVNANHNSVRIIKKN